jgi:ADP-ribose pyrophosphatase YjhB (NUDIX family)
MKRGIEKHKFLFLICLILTIYLLFLFIWNIEKYFPSSSNELIDISMDGQINQSIYSEYPIDYVHRVGYYHRGIWIFILSKQKNLLFVRRSSHTVTCPKSWSITGEHTKYLETYRDTAYRGLLEELNIDKNYIINLIMLQDHPEFYRIVYPNFRYDNQWTMSSLAIVEDENLVQTGLEDSEIKWVPIDLAKSWISECHEARCRSCDVSSFTISDGPDGRVNETNFTEIIQNQIDLIQQYLHLNNQPSSSFGLFET